VKNIIALPFALLTLMAGACVQPEPSSPANDRMTIAKVQREIKIGMSSSDVVEVLGSPNMVTTDSERRESWVYDRVSTEVTSSQAHAGVWLLALTGAGAGASSSRTSQSQKTLTIIVKFDENNKVRDFAYRTSSF